MALFFIVGNLIFFTKKIKAQAESAICEDFGRLNQLKRAAPKLLQAKREANHLEQITALPKAVILIYQEN